MKQIILCPNGAFSLEVTKRTNACKVPGGHGGHETSEGGVVWGDIESEGGTCIVALVLVRTEILEADA